MGYVLFGVFLVLLAVFVLGIVFGGLGWKNSESPSKRSKLSDTGARIIEMLV